MSRRTDGEDDRKPTTSEDLLRAAREGLMATRPEPTPTVSDTADTSPQSTVLPPTDAEDALLGPDPPPLLHRDHEADAVTPRETRSTGPPGDDWTPPPGPLPETEPPRGPRRRGKMAVGLGAAWLVLAVLNAYADRPSLEEQVLDELDDNMSAESARCVASRLEADGVLDDLSTADLEFALDEGFSPEGAAFLDSFVEAIDRCLSPGEIEALGGIADETPLGYDLLMDHLLGACIGGDPEKCDLLYVYQGGVEGAQSQISATCGGRLPRTDPPWCADTLGSVDLDLWRSDCERGDNGACDLLFFYSPIGSDHEAFALTCGGRGGDSFLPCGVRLGLGRY